MKRQTLTVLKRTSLFAASLSGLLVLNACRSTPTTESSTESATDDTEQTETTGETGEEMGEGEGTSESEALNSVLAEEDSLSTLNDALQAANLGDAIDRVGEYTLFAPTNSAFEQLPEGTLEALLQPENQDILQSILKYHIVLGEASFENLKSTAYETAHGEAVSVDVAEGNATIGSAAIEETGIQTENGIVHTIDSVLLPPNMSLSDLNMQNGE